MNQFQQIGKNLRDKGYQVLSTQAVKPIENGEHGYLVYLKFNGGAAGFTKQFKTEERANDYANAINKHFAGSWTRCETAEQEMVREIATALFSQFMNLELLDLLLQAQEHAEPSEVSEDEIDDLMQSYSSQPNIFEAMPQMLQDHGIDYEKFLPLSLTRQIIKAIDTAWEGKYTVFQLWEEDELAARRLILHQCDVGCSPTDDHAIWCLFDSLEITEPPACHSAPHAEVEKASIKLQQAIIRRRPKAASDREASD